MIGLKWVFEDLTSGADPDEYTFQVNPKTGPDTERQKNLIHRSTAAPDGQVLLFEGQDDPSTMELTGILFTPAQLQAFETWYEKRHQVRVTDDLGRQYVIYIEHFSAKRGWKVTHPWRHEWTMRATILEGPVYP